MVNQNRAQVEIFNTKHRLEEFLHHNCGCAPKKQEKSQDFT